jgi:hypothetical protein
MIRLIRVLLVFAALPLLSCSLPDQPVLPAGCMAFGVFGDGPYRAWELGRFRQVLRDVNRSDIEWLIHVGDIFWYPCNDGHYLRQRGMMNAIEHPVVYTPGDNEWVDCHVLVAGGFDPLERLDYLRRTLYPRPDRSLGQTPMRVESQSAHPEWAEFVENVRWQRGGFVFITIHIVGSENAQEEYPERSPAADAEVARRTAAAFAWIDEAFDVARAQGRSGVVIAMHADPGYYYRGAPEPFEDFQLHLRDQVMNFEGEVMLIHGDSHVQRHDHPMKDPDGEHIQRFTRVETYGSPQIGWVRVVVDTVNGEFRDVQTRVTPWWWF